MSGEHVSCLCVLSRPKDNLQLPFVKTVLMYCICQDSFILQIFEANVKILLFMPPFVIRYFCFLHPAMYATRYLCFQENIRKMCVFLLTAGDKWNTVQKLNIR